MPFFFFSRSRKDCSLICRGMLLLPKHTLMLMMMRRGNRSLAFYRAGQSINFTTFSLLPDLVSSLVLYPWARYPWNTDSCILHMLLSLSSRIKDPSSSSLTLLCLWFPGLSFFLSIFLWLLHFLFVAQTVTVTESDFCQKGIDTSFLNSPQVTFHSKTTSLAATKLTD